MQEHGKVMVNVSKKTGQVKHLCYIPVYTVMKEKLQAGDRVRVQKLTPPEPRGELTSIEKPVSLEQEDYLE